jgi:hypothetical protein
MKLDEGIAAGAHRKPGHGEGVCLQHRLGYDFGDALIPPGAAGWARPTAAWRAAMPP